MPEQLIVETDPKAYLMYPNYLTEEERQELASDLLGLGFSESEIDGLLYDESKRSEYIKPLYYYDKITSKFASKFKKEDLLLTSSEFVNLSIAYISPIKDKQDLFKKTFPKLGVDEKKWRDEIAKWARAVNLLSLKLEPMNLEIPMLAAGLADRSPSNSYEIVRGLGRTRTGKPYPALIYRTHELPDFLARGHTSVVELGNLIICVANATRFDMFLSNSQYNFEFRGSEEKSGRDVSLDVLVVPSEFRGDERIKSQLEEIAESLKSLYELEFNGKKLPLEDVRYASLLCARTSTTISVNPFNLAQWNAYVESDPNSTEGYKRFMAAINSAAKNALPTYVVKMTDAGRKAGYDSPPRHLEDLYSAEELGDVLDVKVVDVEIPERLRSFDFVGERDQLLKNIRFKYLVSGSLSMAAQHMRHNYGVHYFESLLSVADRWKVVVPPSIGYHEKSSHLFDEIDGIAHDLYKSSRHVGMASVNFALLGLKIRAQTEANGYSELNYQMQRIDPGAQWEIRRLARMKHNLVERITGGFYTRLLADQLQSYVNSGEAHTEDGLIIFDLEKVTSKGLS